MNGTTAPDFPSNWGRWGDDDELGAVNLITDEARARGAAEARTGVTVSLARVTTPFPLTGGPMGATTASTTAVQTAMLFTGFGAPAMAEVMIVTTHHAEVTHLDGMSHWVAGGKVYPGVDVADSSGPTGVRHGAADVYADGIQTRGVLLDLAPGGRLDPGHPVTGADLDAAAAHGGFEVLPGDAIVVRGGWDRVNGSAEPEPGMTADAIRWMHDHGVAVYAGDIGDARPPLPDDVPGALHFLALGRLAIPLVDCAEPEALAAMCQRLGRWTFQLVIAVPRIAGTTGLPVNPIAVF
ncbi:cyclase family protein [Cryptosporangium arvum]|uniref:Putative metal-dependent hydrolase n=1 Tax=Cryptosporangium arvum DSM 44712 TaxID=927661 RepID=A0A010ZVA6_9ACTN|nr:cyclase family protein [Cryptosporangium arvum]EXG81147.1 putative metal-dependent hydrolase [Cryptosporangium arvum DSM 44712]